MSGQNSKQDDLNLSRSAPFDKKNEAVKDSSSIYSSIEEIGALTERLQREIDRIRPVSAASATLGNAITPSQISVTERLHGTELQTSNMQVTSAKATIPNLVTCGPIAENHFTKDPADRMAFARGSPDRPGILKTNSGDSQKRVFFLERDPPTRRYFARNSAERMLPDSYSPDPDQWTVKRSLCMIVWHLIELFSSLDTFWSISESSECIIWLVIRLISFTSILQLLWSLQQEYLHLPSIWKKFLWLCFIAALATPDIYMSLSQDTTEIAPVVLHKDTFPSPRHEFYDQMEICRSIETLYISAVHSGSIKRVHPKPTDVFVNNYSWSKTEIHMNDSLLEVFLRVPNKKTKFYCRCLYMLPNNVHNQHNSNDL